MEFRISCGVSTAAPSNFPDDFMARSVFGSDFGPVPYGIKEQVQSVEEVLSSPAERELVFWKTSNRIFRLGLSDTGLVTSGEHLVPTKAPASKAA